MNSGGPGICGRAIAISTGNSLPSLRIAGSSTGCPTMCASPVATYRSTPRRCGSRSSGGMISSASSRPTISLAA